MITLHCCGEKYIAEEQHVGRKIKCRRCGRVLTIEAVVPVRTTASAVRGRARQAPWPTAVSYTHLISLYVVILAIVSVALWIGRGFNGSARWQAVRTNRGRGDIDVPPGLLPPAQ